MIDLFLGICFVCLGIIWFIDTIKHFHKSDGSVRKTFYYKGILYSIIIILTGLAFIFGFVNISTFW